MAETKLPKGYALFEKGEEIECNFHADDFVKFLHSLPKSKKGWVRMRIVKRKTVDPRGYTHALIPQTVEHGK